MRKLILALLLTLIASPALAQNTTCANKPSSDSSNACANTRFVHGLIPTPPTYPLSVPNGGTGVGSFTANLPLIGNGTSAIAQGTRSGNTTSFGTTSGSLTSGNCVKWDASGNLIDAGTTCGGGGGGTDVTVVTCTNSAGDGARIQTGINTGKPVHVIGACLLDSSITMSNPSQELYGQGADNPNSIWTQSSILTTGTIICTMAYGGPFLHDFAIKFIQPDTSNRASLTAYNPAVYCPAKPGLRAVRLKISAAMTGFQTTGNSGNSYFSDIEISAFDKAWDIDGNLDTTYLSNIHCWPFDLTANQFSIFFAVPTLCMSVGRVDGLQINNFFSDAGTAMFTFASSGGIPIVQIANFASDGNNGLNVSDGNISISNFYFTLGADTSQAVVQSGGSVKLSTGWVYTAGVSGSTPIFQIQNNGTIFQMANVNFESQSGGDVTEIQSNTGTPQLQLSNLYFRKDVSVSFTYPVVHIVTGRLTAWGLRVSDKGTGTGNFIQVDNDDYHNVTGITAPGWTESNVASAVQIFANNNPAFPH